ncbi:MAG: hypothetical protein RBU21_17465 [FCB group bacterium]|jgi:type II secretory pathway component GspD/PulD (secretin)|nr:hypothetical protein [FCB group bacterium]
MVALARHVRRIAFVLLLPLCAYAEGITIRLDEIPLADFVKLVFSEIAPRPHVIASALLADRRPVSITLRDETPAGVVASAESVLSAHGFAVKHQAGIAWIDKAEPAADELVVYRPRHRPVAYLAEVVEPLLEAKRARPLVKDKPGQAQAVAAPETEPRASIITTEADQLAFAVPAKRAEQLRRLLVELDQPTGEVLLKAAVYEVATTQQDGGAFQLALNLTGIAAGIGGTIPGGSYLGMKAGGLEVLLSALDSDKRFKAISLPQVRVKNGATARFSVGQDVPVLGAQQLDRNGNPMQTVEYKQSGVILSAKPEIRADVIEIDLAQELSSFTTTSTGVNNTPTLIKRAVNTKLTLQPGEVVAIAGLQDDKTDTAENRLPFLGWLAGEESSRQQTEILVFIEAHRI